MAEVGVNDNRKWLYDALTSKGVQMGAYEEFEKNVDANKDWLYNTAQKKGIELGDYDSFNKAMSLPNVSSELPQQPEMQEYESSQQPSQQPEQSVYSQSTPQRSKSPSPYVDGKGKNTTIFGVPYSDYQQMSPEEQSKAYSAAIEKKKTDERAKLSEPLRGLKGAVSEELGSVTQDLKHREADYVREHPFLSIITGYNSEDDPRYRNLKAAENLIDDAEKIVAEAGADKSSAWKNFGRGVRDAAFDVDTWTAGITDLGHNLSLKGVLEKANKGEELSSDEEKLLDASVINLAATAFSSSDVSMGYRVGQTSANSIPFMLEFAINPISSSGNTLAKGLLKYGLKRFGKAATTKAAKVSGRLVGDAAAAAGMTATSSAPRVMANTVERLNDNYSYSVDDDGELAVDKTGDVGTVEALARSGASQFLENQSEMVFNAFVGGGKMAKEALAKFIPGISKLSDSQLVQLYKSIKNNPTVKDVARRTQFHGLVGEYAEEVYNNFANIPLGEMTVEDATDLDKNVETFLSLAPTSVLFGAVGLGGMARERYSAQKNLRRFTEGLNEEDKALFDELQQVINSGDKETAKEFIKRTLADATLTQEEKKERVFAVQEMEKEHVLEDVQDDDAALTPEDIEANKVDIYRNFRRAERKVNSLLPDELVTQLDDVSDLGQFATTNNLDEKQIEALADYLPAKDLFSKYIDYTEGRKEEAKVQAREQATADVEKISNPETGFVTQVKHKFSESPVYLVGGNLSFGEDGLLDRENSTETVYYVDESGERKMAPSADFDSILSEMPTTEMIAQAEANAEQDFVASEEENLASPEILPPGRGETVSLAGGTYLIDGVDENNPGNFSAVKLNANGEIEVTLGLSEQISISPDEYYAAKEAELWPDENRVTEVEDTESDIPQQKKILPDGRFAVQTGTDGSETSYDILDRNGNVVDSDIMPSVDYSALADYVMEEESVLSNDVVQGTEDALQGLEEGTVSQEEQLQGEAEQLEGPESALSRIPLNEAQEPDFESATIEDTGAALLEMNYGDVDEVKDTAVQMVSFYDGELKKAEKMKTSASNPIQIQKLKAERRAKIDGINAKKGYWQSVADAIEQGRKKVTLIDEAAVQVQKNEERLASMTPEEQLAAQQKVQKKIDNGAYSKPKLSSSVRYIKEDEQLGEAVTPQEYVLREIATGRIRFKWGDNGTTHGLASHTGLSGSESERRSRVWAFIADGLTPEEASEVMFNNMPDYVKKGVEQTDVFNMVLDAFQSHKGPKAMFNEAKRLHGSDVEEEQPGYDKEMERQRMEWEAEQNYMSVENYQVYQETIDLYLEEQYDMMLDNDLMSIFTENYMAEMEKRAAKEKAVTSSVEADKQQQGYERSRSNNDVRQGVPEREKLPGRNTEGNTILSEEPTIESGRRGLGEGIRTDSYDQGEQQGVGELYPGIVLGEQKISLSEESNSGVVSNEPLENIDKHGLLNAEQPTASDLSVKEPSSFSQENGYNVLNSESNSVSLQGDNQKVNVNDEVSESIPQGEYGTETPQNPGMEETSIGLRNRVEASTRDAQASGGALSERTKQEIEQRSAESYAKETGQWVPMSDTFAWQPMPSGNENNVYLNTNDGHVYKVNNLMNSKGILPLFERLKLHNQLFPESKYEFVGFTGFDNGSVFPIFKQEYVNGAEPATPEEIDNYMQSLGFNQTGEAEYSNGDVIISDLRPRNVLKDVEGDIYVIDAEFKRDAEKKEAPTPIDKTTDTVENQKDLQSDTALLQDVGVSSADKDSKPPINEQENTQFTAPRPAPGENVLDYANRISESKRLFDAEHEVNTNPTEAQKTAGNYKKGHIQIDGYSISIENPKGSERSGVDANGQPWSVTMNNSYGYIRGTEGVDGDHIDVFLSDRPTEGKVYVIDQMNEDGSFDEHKVMYGFNSALAAKRAYRKNYSPGWKGQGKITEVSKEVFNEWVKSSKRKTKPFAEYKIVIDELGNQKSVGIPESGVIDVNNASLFADVDVSNGLLKRVGSKHTKKSVYGIRDGKLYLVNDENLISDKLSHAGTSGIKDAFDINGTLRRDTKFEDIAITPAEVKEENGIYSITKRGRIDIGNSSQKTEENTGFPITHVGSDEMIINEDAAREELEDIEQKWEDKILDYIAEHYPTQATVSAHTNSPEGLKEKEAMKNDETLKRMRAEADAEFNAADKKVLSLSNRGDITSESTSPQENSSEAAVNSPKSKFDAKNKKRTADIKRARYELMDAKRELSVAQSTNSGYTPEEVEEKKKRVEEAENELNKLTNKVSNDGIRFREVEDKDGSKSLVGIHNIGEEKLRKALKLGGLANPSAAVIDISKQSHEGYGEISLVLPSSMVEKRTGRNAGTWSQDAWTPTYPQVERQFSGKGGDLFAENMMKLPQEMQSVTRQGMDNYMSGRDTDNLSYMFLHEQGKAPDLIRVPPKYSDEVYNTVREATNGTFSLTELPDEALSRAKDIYLRQSGMNTEDYAESMKTRKTTLEENLQKISPKSFRYEKYKDAVEYIDKYGFDYGAVSTFVQDVERDAKIAGRPDERGTMREAMKYIEDHGLQNEFSKWLESINDKYGIKEVIFDGFTPTGIRRYIPNTLENVSKFMKREGRNAATGIGVSFQNFAAGLLKKHGSLKDIRTEMGKLTNVYADVDAFRDKWSEVFYDLGEKLQPNAKGYDDYGLSRLAEAAQTRNPKNYIKDEYGIEFSDEDARRLNEMIDAIRNEYPAMYFETKFERPVYLEEFAAAVVPERTSREIIDAMDKAGLQVFTYKDGDAASRNEAVRKASEIDGVRFRKMDEVNRKFNEELQQQINGTLAEGHVYQLGNPNKELLSAGIPEQGKIVSSVEELSSRLNTPVHIARSLDELPDGAAKRAISSGRGIKAWIDVNTGKVVLYFPNATSVDDAKRSVLHEIVGHKGLRGIFGDGKVYDSMMEQLYKQLPESVQKAVEASAVKDYKGSIAIAMDEYLAEQAENDITPSWWNRVVSAIRNFFREIGLDVKLTANDVKYLLWKSKNRLMNTDDGLAVINKIAADESMKERFHIGEYSRTLAQEKADFDRATKVVSDFAKSHTGAANALVVRSREMLREQLEAIGMSDESIDEIEGAFNSGEAVAEYNEEARNEAGSGERQESNDKGVRFRESDNSANEQIKELNARIASLEKKISRFENQEELRRSVTEFIRGEIDSSLVGYFGKQDLNSLLVQAQNAKSIKSLEKIVMNVKNVIMNAQRRKLQRMIDKLLSLQVQDVNGKNMSIAKNVDDSTRKIFSFLRGKVSDLALSGFEDDMKYLRRSAREKREEITRLHSLLTTVKTEEEKNSINEQISSLETEVEEGKSKLKDLQAEADAVKEQILNAGDIDIDAEMKRLDEKMDNAAMGKDTWTQGDTERMAALNILQGIFTNRKHDAGIEGVEIDKQKLILNNSDLYKKRLGKNETERKRLTEQINENHRRIVAYDRLVNDIRSTQVKQMEMTVEELNELISNGRNNLLRRKEKEMQRKRELIGGAIRSVEGKPIDIFKKNQSKEHWAKKFFSAPMGSFEYMCKRVNTKTLGRDGFLYKRFIAGNEGVLKAYDTYISGMKELRTRLDDKCGEMFGESFEAVSCKSDKVVGKSGVYVTQSQNERGKGYGVRYELPLTKGQAMYIYQVWKMNDGRTKLELQGFDEESVAQIADFIGTEYVLFADWVQDELLKDLREKYNAKYLEMFNTSLAEIENYIPLKIRKEAVRQESSLSEDGNKRKTLEEKAGSLINRTVNTKPVDITYSGFDVLLEHGSQMEEWNAYARVRKDLDYILSSIMFRNQLNANVRGSYESFYDAAEVAAKANHPDSAKYGDEILGKLSKGIVGGNIAFRLNTALKQVLSAPAFLGYSQSPLYIAHLTKNAVKPYADVQWCMKNIPSFYERVKSGTAGNEKLDEKSFSRWTDKYIEIGMIPNKLVDAITCSIGAKSIFDYKFAQLKKSGLKEEEARNQALAEADIYYNATQQSSHPAFMSPMQMSRTFTDRMLTTYQNSNIGYVRKLMAAFYDLSRSLKWQELKKNYTEMYMKEEGLSELEAESKAYRRLLNENRKSVVEIALFGWGLNMLWNIGSQGLLGFFRGDGDDDKWAKDLAFILTSPIKGVPGGNLLESIASGYGMNPFLVYDELDKFMKESKKAIEEDGLISPHMAYITLAKASRYAGVDLEVWGNVYLGVEGLVRDGALEDDGIIDLMYILNSPKSSRVTVAKDLYKNEPILEYAEKIARAYKYIPKRNAWENWVPGAKPFTNRKENEVKKEAERMQMTLEERENIDKMEKKKKLLRKLKELSNDPEAQQKYRERYKEEITP